MSGVRPGRSLIAFGLKRGDRSRGPVVPLSRCPSSSVVLFLLATAVLFAVEPAAGQQLRFNVGHEELQVPDYANLRIGPFYSSIGFSQSIGYRYSYGSTNNIDTIDGTKRGVIQDTGAEAPMVSTLTMRNYIPISRIAELDLSLWLSYQHYPLKTQEDQFIFNVADGEEISASIGYEYQPTSYLRIFLYELPRFSSDYIDIRGLTDDYGGQNYARFQNSFGANADVLIQKDMNLAMSLSRSDVIPADDEFKDQRSSGYNASLAWEYQMNPRLVTGLSANYGIASYPDSNQKDSGSLALSAFGNAAVFRNTTASISAGYSRAMISATNQVGSDINSGIIVASASVNSEISKGLSHAISYNRNQGRGFEGGLDISESFSYALSWKRDMMAMGFSVAMSDTSSQGTRSDGYSDWTAQFNASFPLSSSIQGKFTSTYSVRSNGSLSAAEGDLVSAELLSDYSTWVNRFDTGYSFTKSIAMSAYAEYIDRQSDEQSLSYGRFVTGMNCTYSYQF